MQFACEILINTESTKQMEKNIFIYRNIVFFWGVFAQPKNKINKCLQKVRPYYVRRNGGKHDNDNDNVIYFSQPEEIRQSEMASFILDKR